MTDMSEEVFESCVTGRQIYYCRSLIYHDITFFFKVDHTNCTKTKERGQW